MKFYSDSIDAVLNETASSRTGLSSAEAAARLERDGKNRLKEAKKPSLIAQFFAQLADPMTLILIAAAAISLVTSIIGNEGFADVIIILAVVLVNAILGVYQENKAEKALEALQKMSAATSKVLRDGEVVIVKSEDLVVGDVVLLEAGDAIPADGRLLESASLKIEEAALTGESVPVNKFIDIINLADESNEVPLGDRKNMVYMGSTVVYGRGMFVVTGTGMQTEMGKIADALNNASEGKTPLQLKLAQLSKILTWLVLGISVVIFAVQLIRAGGFEFDTVLHSFMVAVSLAVAAIPEGLAAVVTVVLSIGVTNMSKRNAIIRRLTAVETLGCAQIICSDKTGTLTQNKMTVVETFGDNEKLLATAMALCSDAELSQDGSVTGEPTEAALVAFANTLSLKKYELSAATPRVAEAPFDSNRKMMSTVHSVDGKFVQYTKGAPDEVLARCTAFVSDGKVYPMTDEKRKEILAANKQMADRALRVLAAAYREYAALPENCEPEALEQELVFIGLTGMIDPVRPEVLAAIEQCKSAGIRAIMITGDHIDTATAIAKELGILEEGKRAVTGSEIAAMSDEEFAEVFQSISVYARVQPEHKTRIVNAWRNAGFVTAMTGDGVNDAPSIKSADIGVGMGITGTDVTKNVADMVLADDNFATIVGAVEEGRRIYDNIRKAIQFLLGSNMSEVLCIFIATLVLDGKTLLEPVHLLWINLVTDCFPALALGMEKAEPGIMNRKPRNSREGIFANGMGVELFLQGAFVAALTLTSYFIGVAFGNHMLALDPKLNLDPAAHGTTMAFLTMSMTEIFHSFNMRSQHKSLFQLKTQNKTLLFAALGSFIATTVVCEVPFIADAFGFTGVGLEEYGIAIGLAVLILPIVEIQKLIWRLANKNKNN